MLQLTVDLGARSYPIHIGAALLARPELFATAIRGEKVLIITNDRIAPLYLQSLLATLAKPSGRGVHPAGW
jgi:3-dehydroquinate synthase